jgi:hypothetical protein
VGKHHLDHTNPTCWSSVILARHHAHHLPGHATPDTPHRTPPTSRPSGTPPTRATPPRNTPSATRRAPYRPWTPRTTDGPTLRTHRATPRSELYASAGHRPSPKPSVDRHPAVAISPASAR